MAQTTNVKAGEMLPNGRIQGNPVREAVKDALAKDKGTDGKPTSASITDMANGAKFDAELVKRGVQIIQGSIKQNAMLTRDVFNLIAACENLQIAEGTLTYAERNVIKQLKEGQPEGEKPIKNLTDVARLQGSKQLSYVSVKARLLQIMNSEQELVDELQKWYNFQAKHDGEPQMSVQPEFLNPYSRRYRDPVKGWQQYTKDARLAENCKAMLAARVEALAKARGRDAAGQTGQNGANDVSGVRSGDRQRGNLPESTQGVLNLVIKATQDAYEEVDTDALNGILQKCADSVRKLQTDARDLAQAKIRESSSKPSEAIAAGSRQLSEGDIVREMPEVPLANVAGEDDGESELGEELTEEDEANIEANAPDTHESSEVA